MDLLETFLGRRIQLLQALDHAMWHYTGPSDTTRSHPEDEWTNWHSAVPNGNPVKEEEGSMEGSAGSAEYISDSRETEEETEEEEEESEEQSSSPSPPER
ncbi:hypothetical protein ZWY2020_014471 [Hordeum vulgare]|nr:hypothetical protein ZWY2020_014471 [Hordeum vulgare]